MAFNIYDGGGSGNGNQVLAADTTVAVTICTTPNIANTMFIVTFHWVAVFEGAIICYGVGSGTTKHVAGTNVIKVGKNIAVKVVFTNTNNFNPYTVYYSYSYTGITII